MAIDLEYLGMPLGISDLDGENLEYFRHCAEHNFHLQACNKCELVRYPPTTACPWCACLESRWVPVEGKGAIHSYGEVHHAIQPAFKDHFGPARIGSKPGETGRRMLQRGTPVLGEPSQRYVNDDKHTHAR